MTIDRVGPVNSNYNVNKTDKTSKTVKTQSGDSIAISSDAKTMGEVYKATEQVKLAPDIRQDRIDEIKRKLEDPSYIDEKVVELVAEKVMDTFGLS